MGRSTICCQQFVLYCQRWEETRFVAVHVCLIIKDGEKYDLLPPLSFGLTEGPVEPTGIAPVHNVRQKKDVSDWECRGNRQGKYSMMGLKF